MTPNRMQSLTCVKLKSLKVK